VCVVRVAAGETGWAGDMISARMDQTIRVQSAVTLP
jgi:hypothetical protein